MISGPQPATHTDRLERAQAIAVNLMQKYRGRILALGLYGSMARGTDGPYSDIEMHCVLSRSRTQVNYEWSEGPWKAEVNVYPAQVALEEAALLEGDWPITHGAFVHVLPLHDPTGFFPQMRQVALDHTPEAVRLVLAEVIVGDIYELVGKIRNAMHTGETSGMALFAVNFAMYAACLPALDQRVLFTTTSRVLQESLALTSLPEGHVALAKLVMAGQLDNPTLVAAAIETCWESIIAWAAARELRIETTLEDLLSHK